MINTNVSNDISWDMEFVQNVILSYNNGHYSGFWLVIPTINHLATAATMDIAEFKLSTYITDKNI